MTAAYPNLGRGLRSWWKNTPWRAEIKTKIALYPRESIFVMEPYKLLQFPECFLGCLLVTAVPTPDLQLCYRHCNVHASLLHLKLLLKILNGSDSFRCWDWISNCAAGFGTSARNEVLETCHMHQWILKQGEGLRNVRRNCVFWVKGAVSENLWNPSLETSHEGEQALQNNRQPQKELMKIPSFKLRKNDQILLACRT